MGIFIHAFRIYYNAIFPILTQRLIDDGVNGKNLSVIIYILLAQLALLLVILFLIYLEIGLH